MSLSDEDEDFDENHRIPAKTPLTAFLSFKHETEKRRASTAQTEPSEKVKNHFNQIMFMLSNKLYLNIS